MERAEREYELQLWRLQQEIEVYVIEGWMSYEDAEALNTQLRSVSAEGGILPDTIEGVPRQKHFLDDLES